MTKTHLFAITAICISLVSSIIPFTDVYKRYMSKAVAEDFANNLNNCGRNY